MFHLPLWGTNIQLFISECTSETSRSRWKHNVALLKAHKMFSTVVTQVITVSTSCTHTLTHNLLLFTHPSPLTSTETLSSDINALISKDIWIIFKLPPESFEYFPSEERAWALKKELSKDNNIFDSKTWHSFPITHPCGSVIHLRFLLPFIYCIF